MKIENGKIIISKSQWISIGKKSGWILAQNNMETHTDSLEGKYFDKDKYDDREDTTGLYKTNLFRIRNENYDKTDIYYNVEDVFNEIDSFVTLQDNEEYDKYIETLDAEVFFWYTKRIGFQKPTITIKLISAVSEDETTYNKINPDHIYGLDKLENDALASTGEE